MDNSSERIEAVLDRLERIEVALAQLIDQRTIKEWYATAEVAKILEKSDYTVREWCRKRQIPAEKTANGRMGRIAPYANPAEKQGVATSRMSHAWHFERPRGNNQRNSGIMLL